MKMTDDVARAAAEIRPARTAFTLLALPFYVLGFVASVVYVAGLWAVAAVKVGFREGRKRWQPDPVTPPAAEIPAPDDPLADPTEEG